MLETIARRTMLTALCFGACGMTLGLGLKAFEAASFWAFIPSGGNLLPVIGWSVATIIGALFSVAFLMDFDDGGHK